MNCNNNTEYKATMSEETELDNYDDDFDDEDDDTDEDIVGGYLSFFPEIILHKILIYIVSIVIVYLQLNNIHIGMLGEYHVQIFGTVVEGEAYELCPALFFYLAQTCQ